MTAGRDRLRIRDLRVRAIVGVKEAERREPQELLVQVHLELDLSRAAASDRIEDTVHYGELAREITALAERSSYRLIERLAGAIGEEVLRRHAPVQAVTVRVDKPGALATARFASAEIRVKRG